MKHEDFRSRLDEFVDGILPEAERLAMEAHAAACEECGRELASLHALLDAARALPPAIAPRRDLWPELRTRLPAEVPAGTAPDRAPREKFRPTWPGAALWSRLLQGQPALPAGPSMGLRLQGALRPIREPSWVLAGALAVVVILCFARGVDREPARGSPEGSEIEFDVFPTALSGLERECMGAGKLLQASMRLPVGPGAREAATSLAESLVDGLSILDRSIDETRSALVQDPGNPQLQRMLTARYQRKLALLHAALMRVEEA